MKERDRLLLESLPPEMFVAAEVYLKVLGSRESDPDYWFAENLKRRTKDRVTSEPIAPERVELNAKAKDLLFRSFWFADNHALSLKELEAIFSLSGIHQEEYANPKAVALHKDRRNWSKPIKGYQDQIHRQYIGPHWVLNQLNIRFSQTDLRQLITQLCTYSCDLISDGSLSKLRLSPEMVDKVKDLIHI